MKSIVIIGDGGHSRVIQDSIALNNDMKVSAILDDRYKTINSEGNILLGPVSAANNLIEQMDYYFVIGIGNNHVRKKIQERLNFPRERYISVIHPTAVISSSATIGLGSVVMAKAVINANAKVGDQAIINTGAIIEHDSDIGELCHISPGATITGSVTVGNGSQIGAGAVVIPNLTIGQWCIVGAGSTVIKPVPDFRKAVGAPARLLQDKKKDAANV
jgi:acetyltransferase EpsM